MKKIEADVIVIAAGMSGMCAAVAAAEKGASVVVFEKGGTVGGAASMGMGFFAVESHVQKKQLVGLTVEQAFRKFMEFNHWRCDADLVHKLFKQSGGTVKWIEDMGIDFLGAYNYFNDSEYTWHLPKVSGGNKPAERSGSIIAKALSDRAAELGVEFYFNTPVKKINYDGTRVTGVYAVCDDGQEYDAECDAVIVCTGGFGDNPEMIRQYMDYEHGKDLFSFRIPGLTGEGMRMVWEIGGAQSPVMMEMTYESPGFTGGGAVDTIMRQPNLMVNTFGKRFINEEIMYNTPYTGNAIARQKDRLGISIISDSIIDYYREHGVDFNAWHKPVNSISEWDEFLARQEAHEIDEQAVKMRGSLIGLQGAAMDLFFTADSIRGLAEQMEMDPAALEATVSEYNDMCATGRDTGFCKDRRYLLPITGKKFYALKYYPSGYGSLGGIKVDSSLRVVRPDFSAITGLFSAGTDCCNIFGDTYMFYFPGSTMGYAINSGRMAGYNAVDFIDTYDFDQGVFDN